MSRFNRYLLIYLILGIGLAIAWTQVGRRPQLAPNTGLRVMSIDEHCQPRLEPCAAYAQAFALIAGPDPEGDGLLLVGEKLPADVHLDLVRLDPHSRPVPTAPLLRALPGNRWRVGAMEGPGRLRVNISSAGQQWIAEFPLQ